jgi:hypothetical protein
MSAKTGHTFAAHVPVVERIEAARDEGVVQCADGEQPVPEDGSREPRRGEHEEEVVLGDSELDVLPRRPLHLRAQRKN